MHKFLKYLIVIIIFVSLSQSSYCQEFKGGLILGINGSQMSGDDMAGFDKGGLLAGVYIDYVFTERFEMAFELDFTQKGSKRAITEKNHNPPGLWNSNTVNYLEVPLYAKYKFDWLSTKVKFQIGLAYGLVVGQEHIDLFGNEVVNDDIKFKDWDFSYITGAEYNLNNRFSLFGRYVNSIVSIGRGKSNYQWYRTNTGYLNRVVSIGIKYYLGEKKY